MHKQYECAIIKCVIYLHVEIQCITLRNQNPAYSVTEDSRWTTAAKCIESELSSFLISVLRPIPGAPAGGRGYRGTDVILNANRKRLLSVLGELTSGPSLIVLNDTTIVHCRQQKAFIEHSMESLS